MWKSQHCCSAEAALRLTRRVQRGHDRSFQPYSPMGWRVALRSGRVYKLCQRPRSSGSRYARHRSHIRSFDERARSATAPAVRLAVHIGVATGLVVQGQQEEGTRGVVCTGIDNPGSNVFPASRPVWQWGGTRYNFYLALRLMRRVVMARHLVSPRAVTCVTRL